MRFEWDEETNRLNHKRHKIRFETAILAFSDPYAVTIQDRLHDDDELRFITLGRLEGHVILFLAHLSYEESGEEIIRLISARKATAYEKKIYEKAK